MKNAFYRKLFSRLISSVILSFIISELVFHSRSFIVYPLAFFGGALLLIGWLEYLKLDGVFFFNSNVFQYFRNTLKFMDRFSYKNKGVYNMDKDQSMEMEIAPNMANAKISIYANVSCGIMLLICSQIFTP